MNNHELFDKLYLKDALQQCDIIIGFGHFDPKIPETCSELYKRGFGRKIIYTGGIGAGSTGLSEPEATYFKNISCSKHGIDAEAIMCETASTNTGENVRFTAALLKVSYPEWEFQKHVKSAILVANAYRQFRVYHTMKLYYPNMQLFNIPPKTDYEVEEALFAGRGEDFKTHLQNEYDRIKVYPAKGFMAAPDKAL